MNKENKPVISVIVPIYNAEKYIYRCVDSILMQTYTNLEVILVNDGSLDRCGEICDNYAKKDARVRVVHQENQGLSAARNIGLNICTGEYIAFVDSDDYIVSNIYEKMLQCILKYDVKLCVCQWQFEDRLGKQIIDLSKVNQNIYGKMNSIVFAEFIFKGDYENGVVVAAWNKLYSRKILKNLRFYGRYQEDDAFQSKLLCNRFSVYVMQEQLYVYTENPNSLTHQRFKKENLRILDIMAERTVLFSMDSFIVNEAKKTYCNLYIENYYKAKAADIQMPKRKLFRTYIRDLLRGKNINWKFLCRMLLFEISPTLYKRLLL